MSKKKSILDNMFSPEVETAIQEIERQLKEKRRKENAAKTSIQLKKLPSSNSNNRKRGYTPKKHPGQKAGKRKHRKTKKRRKTKRKRKRKRKTKKKRKKRRTRRGGFNNTGPVLNKRYTITREGSEEGYPDIIYKITKIGQNYIYFNNGTIDNDDLYVDKQSFYDLFTPYN